MCRQQVWHFLFQLEVTKTTARWLGATQTFLDPILGNWSCCNKLPSPDTIGNYYDIAKRHRLSSAVNSQIVAGVKSITTYALLGGRWGTFWQITTLLDVGPLLYLEGAMNRLKVYGIVGTANFASRHFLSTISGYNIQSGLCGKYLKCQYCWWQLWSDQ